MRHTFEIKVPGSTSNLGPGFDMLGLCLDLTLRVQGHWEQAKNGGTIHIEALEGEARELPRNDQNLVLRAIQKGAQAFGLNALPNVYLHISSEIPVARGLGSSGAAIAAGLLIACQLTGVDPAAQQDRLVQLGTELDGHPDNVVASLLGGCTLTLMTDQGPRVLRPPVHASIGFALAWGQTPLPTPIARQFLPTELPFAQALDQPRRLAALLEGLRTGDAGLLQHAEQDFLHVQARLPHIRGGAEALAAARAAGAWLATISGSGSALVALGPHERCEAIASALQGVLEEKDGPAIGRVARMV